MCLGDLSSLRGVLCREPIRRYQCQACLFNKIDHMEVKSLHHVNWVIILQEPHRHTEVPLWLLKGEDDISMWSRPRRRLRPDVWGHCRYVRVGIVVRNGVYAGRNGWLQPVQERRIASIGVCEGSIEVDHKDQVGLTPLAMWERNAGRRCWDYDTGNENVPMRWKGSLLPSRGRGLPGSTITLLNSTKRFLFVEGEKPAGV